MQTSILSNSKRNKVEKNNSKKLDDEAQRIKLFAKRGSVSNKKNKYGLYHSQIGESAEFCGDQSNKNSRQESNETMKKMLNTIWKEMVVYDKRLSDNHLAFAENGEKLEELKFSKNLIKKELKEFLSVASPKTLRSQISGSSYQRSKKKKIKKRRARSGIHSTIVNGIVIKTGPQYFYIYLD